MCVSVCVRERERERKTSWDQSFGINSAKQVECFAINRRNEIHSDVLKSLEKNLKGTERETISFFYSPSFVSLFISLSLSQSLSKDLLFGQKSVRGGQDRPGSRFSRKKKFFLFFFYMLLSFETFLLNVKWSAL